MKHPRTDRHITTFMGNVFRILLPGLLCLTALVQAQSPSPGEPVLLAPFTPVPGPIVITERSDFSRYENSRYTGFSFREARLDLVVEPRPDGSALYRGEALVFEETLRDMRASAKLLDASVPVVFTTAPGGAVEFLEDKGYPILRGIPAPPPQAVQPGSRWTAEATVVVRPRTDAPATRVKVLVEYEYVGSTVWSGMAAKAIRARYAVRYRGGDRLGDPALTGASGGRTADILVDPEDGSTLFIREAIDETYTYSGGSNVRLKGFILHFHRGSLPLDRDRVAVLLGGGEGDVAGAGPEPVSGSRMHDGLDVGLAGGPEGGLAGDAGGPEGESQAGTSTLAATQPEAPGKAGSAGKATGPAPAYEVVPGERGVVLLLYDLRFVPDGADLLPVEQGRLDAIAEALKRLPDRSFLVEGHAADVGRPQGQYELSRDRARRIVDELAARGIPAGRFVFRGLGADQPIAPNDTEQGRARNRRVEITILD
jgi:outer membrane protein OmpA-like peptidoglycan-associated protein